MKKRRFLFVGTAVFAAIVLLLLLCRLLWLQPFKVVGRSMQPTVLKGDLILVNKLAYSFDKPKRGDIVFFDTARFASKNTLTNKCVMKRIIALPGERVSIRPPYIYINGKPLKDPPIFEAISFSGQGYAGYGLPDKTKFPDAPLKTDSDEITLSADEFFLIGDNTMNSLDSRHFGPIKASSIISKVTYILAPSDRRGPIK